MTARGHEGNPALPYVLAACTAVSVLSTDLITPSIPDLPEALDGSIFAAQLTVSVNLAAYAVAQLAHGPLADSLGRKRLLVWGMGLFMVASVVCALMASIGGLLVGRFVQGLFSSVPSVVVVLIIRELYAPERAMRAMALYGAAMGIAPAVGPLIGGYLHIWFGWQAGFWFLAAAAFLAAVLVILQVPESLPRPRPLRPMTVLTTYRGLLANRSFTQAALGLGMGFGAFFAYITTAPLVFIDQIGIATQHFGLTSLAIVGAFITGNITASRLSRSMGAEQILQSGTRIMLVSVGLLTLGAAVATPDLLLIILPMMGVGFALAFMLSAGPLAVLDKAGDAEQGSASALLGAIQLAASAFGGLLAALLYNETALPMALVMLVMAALSNLLLSRKRLQAVRSS